MKYLKWLVLLLGVSAVFYLIVQLLHGGKESSEGEFLYQFTCSDCHGKQGEGFKDLYPPLKNSDWLKARTPQELACLIHNGHQGDIIVNGKLYNQPMPAFKKLTNIEVSNLISYINQAFADKDKYVNQVEITRALEECR